MIKTIEIINGRGVECPERVGIDIRRLGEVLGIAYRGSSGPVTVTCVCKLQEKDGGFVFYDQYRALHRLGPETEILKVEYRR